MSYAHTARMSRRIQPRVDPERAERRAGGQVRRDEAEPGHEPEEPDVDGPEDRRDPGRQSDPRLELGERPDAGEDDADGQEQGRLVGEQRPAPPRRGRPTPPARSRATSGPGGRPRRGAGTPRGRRRAASAVSPRAIQGMPRTRTTRSGGTKTSALIARWRTVGDPGSATEAARPPGELRESRIEGVRAEVRPQDVAHVQLGVGRLPDEEVREALLAAGPDHEVGVGQAGRVERGRDRRFVDRLGWRCRSPRAAGTRRRARSGRRS